MLVRLFLGIALVCLGFGPRAQSAPSIEDFARLPEYSEPSISRNGNYLAVRIPHNGRMNLAVIELDTLTRTTLTTYSEFDVIDVDWIGNDRLLYKLGRFDSPTGSGEFEGGGLFMISRDGRERLRLTETRRDARTGQQTRLRSLEYVRSLPGNDDEVIALGNLREPDSYDLYRLNITNGQTVLLTPTRPERTVRYVLDRNRVPRVAVASVKDSLVQVVHYRRDERSPWQELLRYEGTRPGIVHPLRFEADNRTLVVATNIGRDNMAVYRYDPEGRKLLDLLFEHPDYDIGADAGGGTTAVGSVFTDGTTDEVLGYTIIGARLQTVWLTESSRRLQRVVDRMLPDTYNRIFRLRGDRYLVSARSDRWPITWHILDDAKGTLEDLLASHPWLMPDKLVEMRPFTLTTRDGVRIPSYYLLPKDRNAGERLPTVVHVHGGPAVRADVWGALSFGVREAQLLASRGYAVVLPGFRITPGFGNRVYYSGFGTLGRQMLDDHEDAARWAVEQGIADAERICISGASYGGYATLMSLARFPATFKCGVAGLVVSDLPLQLTSAAGDTASSDRTVAFWTALIGVGSVAEIPRELSPVNLADRIRQPLMMYAGADDLRTPLEQTTRMVEALRRAGNPPRSVVIKPGEGHGFGRPENRVELYTTVLRFLDEQIGPGRRP